MVTSAAAPNLSLKQISPPPAAQRAGTPSAPVSRPPLPQPLACTILTSSGSVVARALALTRPSRSGADQLEVVVSDVEPRGALEPIHHAGHEVVLRTPLDAQLALRIDAIVGPPQRREFILQPAAP